jgi:aspartyl-tRNA(Asn)/glutamyl-tRNA(Gln) amidotransferase subunit C
MHIDSALILKIENLARLELSEEEREQLNADLNKILQMVEKLQEVDTSGVDPLVYISAVENAWREDLVSGQVDCAKALSLAPATDGAHFLVPKVL